MSPDSALLATAIRHHQSGQVDQALALYQQLLSAEPDHPDLLNLVGAAYINLNDFPRALTHLQRAVAVQADHAGAHENLGVLWGKQANYPEAIASFRRALAVNPNSAGAWLNLAGALRRSGQTDDAIEALRKVTQLNPQAVRAHRELTELLLQSNRPHEAVPHLRALVTLAPQEPRHAFELADALARCRQTDQAIAAYHAVLRLKPDSAEALVNLTSLHADKNQLDEAVACARKAIELRPRFAEAHLNLGTVLIRQEKFAEAAEALRIAAQLKPELAEIHNNLGILAAEEEDYDRAIGYYRHTLDMQPTNADAIYNLGIALFKQGHARQAIDYFNRAIALRPDYAEAHHNRAAAWLLLGDFQHGWPEYEWRFRSRYYGAFRPSWPIWNGTDSLAGRTIVLCTEQGLGDTLQFIRFAEVLKRQGARVLVECRKLLHALLRDTPGVDGWITPGDTRQKADCCIALMSIPDRLGLRLDTIPTPIPYITPRGDLVETWRARLAEWPELKVGIAWQGNPKCPGDRRRSIALHAYAPLAQVPGVRLISLQKGLGSEQLAELADTWPLVDFGAALDATEDAFLDTAAIVKQLDLVITSDTAMAHLAGALGVPVWLALSDVPDWRWLLDREDSPWYPSMRLFRQPEPRDWASVFQRIAGELTTLANARQNAPAAPSA